MIISNFIFCFLDNNNDVEMAEDANSDQDAADQDDD